MRLSIIAIVLLSLFGINACQIEVTPQQEQDNQGPMAQFFSIQPGTYIYEESTDKDQPDAVNLTFVCLKKVPAGLEYFLGIQLLDQDGKIVGQSSIDDKTVDVADLVRLANLNPGESLAITVHNYNGLQPDSDAPHYIRFDSRINSLLPEGSYEATGTLNSRQSFNMKFNVTADGAVKGSYYSSFNSAANSLDLVGQYDPFTNKIDLRESYGGRITGMWQGDVMKHANSNIAICGTFHNPITSRDCPFIINVSK